MKRCFGFLIVLSFVLSACASPSSAKQNGPIEITDAWVRTVDGMMDVNGSGSKTALFMNIKNNSETGDKLIKAKSDAAKMVQIHLSEIDANGVSSMHEVDGVEIPAGRTAALKPGGYHVMLMGLTRNLQEGDTVTFTITFQHAGKVTIEAPVKTP